MRTLPGGLVIVGMVLTMGASPTRAEGYLAVGLGSGARLHGDVSGHVDAEHHRVARIAAGQRVGPAAIEAVLVTAGMSGTSSRILRDTQGDPRLALTSLGVDLKVHVSLAGPIEGYLRGGLSQAWLLSSSGSLGSGRGLALGVGVQLSLRSLPLARGALWIDAHRQMLTLAETGQTPLTGHVDMVTVGLSLGLGVL